MLVYPGQLPFQLCGARVPQDAAAPLDPGLCPLLTATPTSNLPPSMPFLFVLGTAHLPSPSPARVRLALDNHTPCRPGAPHDPPKGVGSGPVPPVSPSAQSATLHGQHDRSSLGIRWYHEQTLPLDRSANTTCCRLRLPPPSSSSPAWGLCRRLRPPLVCSLDKDSPACANDGGHGQEPPLKMPIGRLIGTASGHHQHSVL